MKRKCFTLIELLAVIVILAIIALIATPIVLDIIDDSKEASNQRSIELYKSAVEQAFADAQLNGQAIELGYYRGSRELVNGNTKIKVNYKGKDINCLIIQYTTEKLIIDKCEVGSIPKETLDEYVLKTEYGVEIGDYVNYDPTNGGTINETYISTQEKNGVIDQTFTTESYKGKWQVLGVDNLGRIKLISSDIIEPTTGGSASSDGKYNYYQLKGEAGYINGIDELNNIGLLFSKGQYAASGRSVNLEDLTAISPGMDLNKVEHGNDKNMYHNSKAIGSYGYTVSYKYNSDGTKVNYKSENGATMTIDADMFYHYDDSTKTFIRNSNADKTKTYTLTNNLNEYNPRKIFNVSYKDLNDKGYRWYELLYRNTDDTTSNSSPNQPYYLATRRDYANANGYNSYGIYNSAGIDAYGLTMCKPKKSSTNDIVIDEKIVSKGIRVVVTLSDNASLVRTSSTNLNNMNYIVFNITNKGTYANGKEVYFNVTTGKKCNNYTEKQSNTGVKSGCMKFYAFNDDSGDTLNLILDHNTTTTVAWNSSGSNVNGPKEVLTQLKNDTSSWIGTITPSNYISSNYTIDYSEYKARLITVQEIAQITSNTSWNEKTASMNYFFDSVSNIYPYEASSICKTGNTTGCSYGWLYDRTNKNCTTYGCKNNSDQETYGYWTVSSYASLPHSRAWYVTYSASVYHDSIDNSDFRGVRPVITVLKSQLN